MGLKENKNNNKILFKKNKILEEENKELKKNLKNKSVELKALIANLEDRISKESEKNRLLFQQSRLASMGEMIGNIAHQWRQPLSELGIDLFKMKNNFYTKDKDSFEEAYSHSKMVIKKMSQTIDDFRDFFKINKKKECFLLEDAIKEAIMMLRGTLQHAGLNIQITAEQKIQIYGHKSEFTQVIVNIINNAKDAFLNTDVVEKIIHIEISLVDLKKAIVKIRDNAGGIKKEIMAKIFEPYFTTKHPSMGTGLGLYMSKMIIETSMNGKIEVCNLGNGACFTIIIPRNCKNI